MKKQSFIWITFQKKGIHYYPQAKNDPRLQDVKYLGYPHRHLFKFKVWIEVFHNDRDIEFHQFLNFCEGLYENGVLELNHKSCEMISDELVEKIKEKYPNRDIKISVSEDGEVGSEIYYPKENK